MGGMVTPGGQQPWQNDAPPLRGQRSVLCLAAAGRHNSGRQQASKPASNATSLD